jgi:hypothetical protein
MLRFRNRFKATTSEAHTCMCGRHVTLSVADGRETIIHELPWCEAFEAIIAKYAPEPGVTPHVAVCAVGPGVSKTLVIADGDSVEDVRDPGVARP